MVPQAASPVAVGVDPDLPAAALRRLLDQLAALVLGLDADTYCARWPTGTSGSIGEHVRHCLDHVGALLTAPPSGCLSYDRRRRGTQVETDPGAAARQIMRLNAALERWTLRPVDEPVRLALILSEGDGPIEAWSTLGRELAFVINHTIHHQALVGVLLAVHGHAVPDHFGYAPSTPRHS